MEAMPVVAIGPMMERIIGLYENTGYPFVSVRLDTIRYADDLLRGKLVISPGDRFRVDSIMNRTGYRISNKLLGRIAGIRPGDVYSEQAVREAATRLSSVRWLAMKRPSEVGFHDQSASLFVYPAKAAANRFDGWIGLSAGSAGSALSVAGALTLELINPAGQGDAWNFNWKRSQDQSQNLRLSLDIPWLASLPVGISATFGLHRQDTSYLNLEWEAGVPYSFNVNHHLNLFYRYQNSTLLVRNPTATPAGRLPYSVWLTGLSWKWEQWDNPVNPSTGFSLMAEASTGLKTIEDSSALRQSEFLGDISWFQPVAGNLVFALRARAGYKQTPESLENEAFRLGGAAILRGFYEDTYRSNSFVTGSLELRYLLNQYSHILLLADLGCLDNLSGGIATRVWPYGIGAGGQLRTAGGIFQIIFAVGQEIGQSVNLSTGKIHIGYIGLF